MKAGMHEERRARPEPAAHFLDTFVLFEEAGVLLAVRARSRRIGLDKRQTAQLHKRRFGV